MIDGVGSRAKGRFPFTPFPRGWFFFELARNLPTGRLVSRQWMGESVVAWRGEDGNVCIANAFCPHLGAKLAPETGGTVRDGNLVCPFHGFTYDTSGACVATPTAEPNPACRLRVYPSEEINGFVFGYYDERGRAPEWHLPTMDETGWTTTLTHVYSVRTYPQETSENVIDLSHLSFLHGFEGVGHSGNVEVDGPCFKTDFRVDGSYKFPLLKRIGTELDAEVQIWGLGFLFVETVSKSLGARTWNWFLATPVDGDKVDILVSAKVQALDGGGIRGLNLVPRGLREKMMLPLVMYEFKKNIENDFMIWENKAYRPYPFLNDADGEILNFRRYCTQFYPESENRSVSPATA